jgi:hypothetical protein
VNAQEHKGPKAANRSGGRLAALLHTNILCLNDVVWWVRGHTRFWPDTIDEAGLPDEVRGAVRRIVKQTRLWNHERVDVARELCNHAADALDAGKEPDAVASEMGNTRVIARLIRRSMKRKRHWVWHARAWVVRALGVTAAVAVLLASFITARFFIGDPSPSRNMFAELNAPFAKYTDDERSWALIKEAWSTFAVKRHVASESMQTRVYAYVDSHTQKDVPTIYDETTATPGVRLVPRLPEDHPDRDAVMALYHDVQGELAIVREAAARPVLGMLYSSVYTEFPQELLGTPEAHGWMVEPLPAPDDPAEQGMVIDVMLPALGPMRTFSKWLAFDARVRAGAGDGEGAVASIGAMLGLADQITQDPFLISRLVVYSIDTLTMQAISDVLVDNGDALTDDHLVHLAHMLAAKSFDDLPLESEEMWLDDFLQRAFTDNGEENGHLTNEGVKLLAELESLSAAIGDGIPKNVSIAVSLAMVAPRQEQVRVRDRVFAQFRREEDAGYGIYRQAMSESDTMVAMLDEHRYRPLAILLPALGKSLTLKLENRARLEACAVGLATELYKRKTGDWPGSIGDLVPRYLPSIPEDPFTGGDIRLAIRDGHPVVYAVGPDGDDDGGTLNGLDHREFRPRTGGRPPQVWDDALGMRVDDVPDGDWVLFPVPH